MRDLIRRLIRETILQGPFPSGAMTKDADLMIDAANDMGPAVAHAWLNPGDKIGVWKIMRPYADRYMNSDGYMEQDEETVMYDFLANYETPDHFDAVRKALDFVKDDVEMIRHGKNGEVIVKVNKSVARDAIQPLGFRVVGYDSNGTKDYAFMELIPNEVYIRQRELYDDRSWQVIKTTPERTTRSYYGSLLHAMDEANKCVAKYGWENVAGPDSVVRERGELVDPRMPSVAQLRASGKIKP